MNSNQRSQGNNQSDNAGNEKKSKRGGNADKQQQSRQSAPAGTGVDSKGKPGQQESIDRVGSQSGSQQKGVPGTKQSNDLAGGLPRSPAGKHMAADQDMDEDTGLSNRSNRRSIDTEGNR